MFLKMIPKIKVKREEGRDTHEKIDKNYCIMKMLLPNFYFTKEHTHTHSLNVRIFFVVKLKKIYNLRNLKMLPKKCSIKKRNE